MRLIATPLHLKPYWFHAPTVDRDALEKYVDLVLRVDTDLAKDDALRARMARGIVLYCGHHVGLISATLSSVLTANSDGSRDACRGVRYLHPAVLYNSARVLGGGNGVWKPAQLELMSILLRSGRVTFDLATCHNEWKDLVRDGYLAQYVDPANLVSLTELPEKEAEFTFSHPFQADRFRALAMLSLTSSMSAQAIVIALLPLMPAHCFLSAAVRGTLSALAEAPLQHGFYFAACTAGIAIDAEMAVRDVKPPTTKGADDDVPPTDVAESAVLSTVSDAAESEMAVHDVPALVKPVRGRPVACDFVLRLPVTEATSSTQRDVAIEFLTDNKPNNASMKSHLERFNKGGAYAVLNENFVVVSFEMTKTPKAVAKNTMVVSPHP